jgi:Fur family ferric uptake transcriptional regulator
MDEVIEKGEKTDWVERVTEYLSKKGHRLTDPRRAILEQILRYKLPFTAEELLADMQKADLPVGRATVYRTLELLHGHQWLSLVHRPEGEHGYVVSERTHQHHLVCRNCSSVIAFEGCELETLLDDLAVRLNFQIEGHWLEAFGLCQTCQRAQEN